MGIILWLVVGAIAGWLAGQVVKGGGFGLIGDIIVGIIGAVIAGYVLPNDSFPGHRPVVRQRDHRRLHRRRDPVDHHPAHQAQMT